MTDQEAIADIKQHLGCVPWCDNDDLVRMVRELAVCLSTATGVAPMSERFNCRALRNAQVVSADLAEYRLYGEAR